MTTTRMLDQLTDALAVWPLDREQRVFIDQAVEEISKDKATELINLLSAAELLLNEHVNLADIALTGLSPQVTKTPLTQISGGGARSTSRMRKPTQ